MPALIFCRILYIRTGILVPFSIITAIAQEVRVMVEPERWIVAQSGITKSAILGLQPFFLVHSNQDKQRDDPPGWKNRPSVLRFDLWLSAVRAVSVKIRG